MGDALLSQVSLQKPRSPQHTSNRMGQPVKTWTNRANEFEALVGLNTCECFDLGNPHRGVHLHHPCMGASVLLLTLARHGDQSFRN